MLIGSKPIHEMSQEELLAAIEELQANREALAAEARKRTERGQEEKKPRRASHREVQNTQPQRDILAKLLAGGKK